MGELTSSPDSLAHSRTLCRYQATVREEQLARAKELLIQQKDEIRGLRSAEFLAEVLRERGAQADSSGDRARAMDTYYTQFDEAKAEEDQEAINAEVEKQARIRLQALDTAKSQLEQAAEHRAARRSLRQNELTEQNRLAADAADFFADEEAKERTAKDNQHDLMADMHQATAAKRSLKEKERELLKLEEERNAVYEESKAEMYAERARRAKDARAEVIAQRDALVDQLFVQKVSDDGAENERIAKAIEEQNQKRDSADAAKAKGRAEAQASITEHMIATMTSKAAATKAERDAAMAEQARVLKDTEKFFEEEKRKSASRRANIRGVQKDWDVDIAEHRKATDDARQMLVQMRLDNEAKTDSDRLELIAYAEKRLQAAEERGCPNTYGPFTLAIQSRAILCSH
jgi:hypothetical protein